MTTEGYYSRLYRERRELREADSLLDRIALHLDEKTRATIWPLRVRISDELHSVINGLYQKD